MRVRPLLLLAVSAGAIGCAATKEVPTAPNAARALAYVDAGFPPPTPPLDTQSVSATVEVSGTSYQFAARYFVNRPGTLAWLDFASNDAAIATPNARFSYNSVTGRTQGTGTVTLLGDGSVRPVVLDLSRIEIVAKPGTQPFGACDPKQRVCGSATFVLDGATGEVLIALRRRTDDG